MKIILAVILNFVFNTSSFAAQNPHAHMHDQSMDKPSVHGMLLFGQSKIYLSHLPMFHAPHDYQVIVEAELSATGKAAYLKSLSSSPEKVYTLVPEAFVLPEMIKNPRTFQAQIFKGHFERGGEVIADAVTVQITKVIYFKKFDLKEVKPKNGNYILFGNKDQQFLAHAITVKPDFDQIIEIESTGEEIATSKTLALDSTDNVTPLADLKTYDSANMSLQTKSSLYIETDDLSF